MTNSYHPPLPTATEIAQRLGLHRAGRGWRGDCPICQYKQSLALDVRDGRPLLWCASCQDSAGLATVLRQAAGGGVLPSPRPARLPRLDRADAAARLERARAIWDGAEEIEADTPAGKYLEMRRIAHVASSHALRWRRDTPHPSGGRRIALLARIDAPDGKFSGLQRVFLKPDGSKADIEPAKASIGVIAGGACRLQPARLELVIGEGIESSAAAGAILGLPAWSAISCGNLGRSLALPEAIRAVVIAVDRDEPGQAAAREAWRRWKSEGKQVRFATPKQAGADFNDLAQEGVR